MNANETAQRIDRFFSIYLDGDLSRLSGGQICVVPSERRYQPEVGYGFTHVLWLLMSGGRCLISTQHEIVQPMIGLMNNIHSLSELYAHRFDADILKICSNALPDSQLSIGAGPKYTCCDEDFKPNTDLNVHPITGATLEKVAAVLGDAGLALPYTVQEKTAFVYELDGQPVACCGTLPIGHMEDEIGEVGSVFTLPTMRNRGCAKAVVAATTQAVLRSGRVSAYSTWDANIASQRTAMSVGYKKYGWALYVKRQAE